MPVATRRSTESPAAYWLRESEERIAEVTEDTRRQKQIPPDGDWRVCLFHPGRGWGKGFAASHWIRDRIVSGEARQIALVGATSRHVRQLMIEEPDSGLLSVCPDARYYPSRAEVQWAGGAVGYICSAENADEPPLRGGNFDTVWADEVDSWGLQTTNDKAAKAWENLELSTRKGDARTVVTSTPKPGRVVASLLERARDHGDVVTVTGSTYENADNLSPQFIATIERRYKGTRLERQEIYGEVLDEVHGALWTPESFCYRKVEKDHLGRVVVGVDPSGGGNEIGIVAAGELGGDYIVLDDWTTSGSPKVWADKAVALCRRWGADCIAAERNFGGDMVLSTIKNADDSAPVRLMNASRGKHVRAQPISLLYEQGRVWHRQENGNDGAPALDLLEDQLRHMTMTGYEGEESPDRADAAIWALTELVEPTITKRAGIWGTRNRGRR